MSIELTTFQLITHALGESVFGRHDEAAIDAGIRDVVRGRIFSDSRPRGEHNRAPYQLGFDAARFVRLHNLKLYDVRRPDDARGQWTRFVSEFPTHA